MNDLQFSLPLSTFRADAISQVRTDTLTRDVAKNLFHAVSFWNPYKVDSIAPI
jgi:hypothetical protein